MIGRRQSWKTVIFWRMTWRFATREGRVRCPVHVNWVGFKTELVTRNGECLDLIEQHYGGTVHGQFRNRVLEQFGDCLLAAAMRRTHQRMRINFNKSTLRAGKLLRDLVCKAAGERCLSRSGCAGEKNQPVEGCRFKRQLLPDGERQHGLREQAFAYAVGQHDRVPSRGEFVARQEALACYAIGIAHAFAWPN